MTDGSDVFIQAMEYRIDNINDVVNRAGGTSYLNGMKDGFRYALAVHKEIVEKEQL